MTVDTLISKLRQWRGDLPVTVQVAGEWRSVQTCDWADTDSGPVILITYAGEGKAA